MSRVPIHRCLSVDSIRLRNSRWIADMPAKHRETRKFDNMTPWNGWTTLSGGHSFIGCMAPAARYRSKTRHRTRHGVIRRDMPILLRIVARPAPSDGLHLRRRSCLHGNGHTRAGRLNLPGQKQQASSDQRPDSVRDSRRGDVSSGKSCLSYRGRSAYVRGGLPGRRVVPGGGSIWSVGGWKEQGQRDAGVCLRLYAVTGCVPKGGDYKALGGIK
jgi:hypothetical protein